MRIATAADDGDDEPRRRKNPAPSRDVAARQLLLRLGKVRFGEPDPATAQRLAAVVDLDHLDRTADRIFEAVSWDDLLGTP